MTQEGEQQERPREGVEPTHTGGATTSGADTTPRALPLPFTFASEGPSNHTKVCKTRDTGKKRLRTNKTPSTESSHRPRTFVDLEEDPYGVRECGRFPTLNITMPPQFEEYFEKTLEEYKKLAESWEKSKIFLKDLLEKKELGIFPHSLRIRPPKLKISNDDQINSALQEKMSKLCDTYKNSLLDAYIEAQTTLAVSQGYFVSEYPKAFQSHISKLFVELGHLDLLDTRTMIYNGDNYTTSDLWRHTCGEWSNTLIRRFKEAINDYKLQQFLKEKNDHNAHIQRGRARDQAMEEVDNLPREETIGNLVEKAVASKVQPFLSKFEKLLDKVGKPSNADITSNGSGNKKTGKKGQKVKKNGNGNTTSSGNEPTKVNPHNNNKKPSVTQNRKGKNKMGDESNSKNGMDRKQEDGGTTKNIPSNALASSSKPRRKFRRYGSGTKPNKPAPPTKGAHPTC